MITIYIPNNIAKSLRMNHKNCIGILTEDITSSYTTEVIDGISEYFGMNDYILNMQNLGIIPSSSVKASQYVTLENKNTSYNNRYQDITTMLDRGNMGLIYIGIYPQDIRKLIPFPNMPIVYVCSYSSNERSITVNYDDFQGAKLAVDYLIAKQHQRIALITGALDSITSHRRMLGYQAALMENNLQIYTGYIKRGNWHYEDGYNLCNQLLDLPNPPTAIFVMSDLMAYGAINCAKDRGLDVPKDLSIHGFDNLEFSSVFNPPLTTVSLPLREMGKVSADKLIKLTKGEELYQTDFFLKCQHVERNSVSNI